MFVFIILRHYFFWQIFFIFLKCENVKSVRVGNGFISVSDVTQKDKIEDSHFSQNIHRNKKEIDQNEDKVKYKRYLRNQGISYEQSDDLFFIDNVVNAKLSEKGEKVSDITINENLKEMGEMGEMGKESTDISNVNNIYGNTFKNRVIEGNSRALENRESMLDYGIISKYNNNNNKNNDKDIKNNNYDKDSSINMNIIKTDEEVLDVCETKYKLVDKLKRLNFIYSLVKKSKVMKTINLCSFESYVLCSVTIRNTNSMLDVLSTVYGFMPYIFFLLIMVAYIFTLNKNILFLILMFVVETICVEYILKNIIKMKRPYSSAVKSYGMPSGHSAFSVSCITLIGSYALEKRQHDVWSYIVMGLLLPLFLPIPWSRMHIQDHTISQIVWGSMIGVLFGLCCYLLRNKCAKKTCDAE